MLVVLALGVLTLGAPETSAQDLFELEVFRAETTPAGEYEIALHTNGLSRGGTVAGPPSASHRPVHVSVEVTRGWTSRFEAALFLQTAPFGERGSARFAGGHVRAKLRLVDDAPVRLALGAEYAFNDAAFSDEVQTFELTPIVDFRQGRLVLVANPSLEVVTRGHDDGLDPAFNMSARAAWQLTARLALATDYFSRSPHTRHLRPEPEAHRFVFSGFDLELTSGWEWGLSAGHCVTQDEPWLLNSVIAYGF